MLFFIPMLLLAEGQTGEACKPSNTATFHVIWGFGRGVN
jgi:hypothetical protein